MKTLINNHLTHVEQIGPLEGPPVVFLHAFPLSSRMWAPTLPAVPGHWRAITYDMRGHGETAPSAGPFTLEHLVDDLEAILDFHNIESAVLCGLSMGGYLALRAVNRMPERVKGLILSDTRSEADSNEAKLGRANAIDTLHNEGIGGFTGPFLEAALGKATRENKPELVRDLAGMFAKNTPSSMVQTLMALASRLDSTVYLKDIKVPTLVLCGEDDTLTPPEAARSLADKIPGAELQLIPEAGHIANMEQPEVFNGHIGAFLESLS